tara:strand:+ start:5660 stop:6037 length:378 start_codon:yes stop_codon:yes gene_type:complete
LFQNESRGTIFILDILYYDLKKHAKMFASGVSFSGSAGHTGDLRQTLCFETVCGTNFYVAVLKQVLQDYSNIKYFVPRLKKHAKSFAPGVSFSDSTGHTGDLRQTLCFETVCGTNFYVAVLKQPG